MRELNTEKLFIGKLAELKKYTWYLDIIEGKAFEYNYHPMFEAQNCAYMLKSDYNKLRDQIIEQETFVASKTLQKRNIFHCENGNLLTLNTYN